MESFIDLFNKNGKSLEVLDTALDALLKDKKLSRRERAALAAFYRYIETYYPSYLDENNSCIKIAKKLNNTEFSKLWNHLLPNRKQEATKVLEYLKTNRGENRLITLATANDGILKIYTGKKISEDEILWLKGALARAYIAPQAGLVQRTFMLDGRMEVEGLLFSKGKCWPIPSGAMKRMTQTGEDGTLSVLPDEDFITPGLVLPQPDFAIGEERTGYFPSDKGFLLISRVARDYRDTASKGQAKETVGNFQSCNL